MSDLFASLRFRLLLALVAVFALGTAAMVGLNRIQALGAHQAIEETSLATQAHELLKGLRLTPDGRLASLPIPADWRGAYHEREAAFFTLYDPLGRPVARSKNLTAPLAYQPMPAGQTVSPLRIDGPQQNLVLSTRAPGGYQLTVARTNPGQFDAVEPDVVEDSGPIVVFCLFAVLGLAAAWGVIVFSLRPLVRASQEAALIGPEATSVRLTESALPTEARPLAAAVNAALDRVEAAFEGEKRFTADAAHALRTPLTVLNLRLQRAGEQDRLDWPAVRRDLDELARLVAGLLQLSRAERAASAERQAVNLARLVRETAASFAPRLEAEGRAIEVIAPDAAEMSSPDVGALRDMISVLIDNALSHGRGAIQVELTTSGGWLVLSVSDEGEGVAPDAREAVFERFHKLDANSPGAGLGLAIARHTARRHGGDAVFTDAATVEVRLSL